jgi:ubiquilin
MQLQRSGMIPSLPGLGAGGGFPPGIGFPSRASAAAPPVPSSIAGLDFSAILGASATPNPSSFVPPAATTPAARYASQLRQLADMGFHDEAANLRALTATNGNVNNAVERLLSGI